MGIEWPISLIALKLNLSIITYIKWFSDTDFYWVTTPGFLVECHEPQAKAMRTQCENINSSNVWCCNSHSSATCNNHEVLSSALSHDLITFKQQLGANCLHLNVGKTKFMFIWTWLEISLLPNQPVVSLDWHQTRTYNVARKYKFLRGHQDGPLSWDSYISKAI